MISTEKNGEPPGTRTPNPQIKSLQEHCPPVSTHVRTGYFLGKFTTFASTSVHRLRPRPFVRVSVRVSADEHRCPGRSCVTWLLGRVATALPRAGVDLFTPGKLAVAEEQLHRTARTTTRQSHEPARVDRSTVGRAPERAKYGETLSIGLKSGPGGQQGGQWRGCRRVTVAAVSKWSAGGSAQAGGRRETHGCRIRASSFTSQSQQ